MFYVILFKQLRTNLQLILLKISHDEEINEGEGYFERM
jgi:hypothetical protein